MKRPSLTLVGAGPGDPELLTIKAVKVIRSADVVLYDALVSEDILALIPPGIPAWSVGKRAGAHSHLQEDINSIIVNLAHKHGHVVRLKGGDPFVFGRGYEEMHYAAQHGLAVAVVPGISSALAVPASANVPLTARGISESFFVITGTTKEGGISNDIYLAAQSTATVVILMGLSHLGEIMQQFEKAGKSTLPATVIENGTLPTSRSVTGTVATIEDLVAENKISSPAVIVVGKVVECANEIQSLTREQPVSDIRKA
ncbi:MAG TPA: uroporphyrinogen-III C-methyltransferase [Cyclobacteriaceae bacterium]|nr:uroporphyrinogen-III C-methyltransferase [Cyclobacteriaceae bacterium]